MDGIWDLQHLHLLVWTTRTPHFLITIPRSWRKTTGCRAIRGEAQWMHFYSLGSAARSLGSLLGCVPGIRSTTTCLSRNTFVKRYMSIRLYVCVWLCTCHAFGLQEHNTCVCVCVRVFRVYVHTNMRIDMYRPYRYICSQMHIHTLYTSIVVHPSCIHQHLCLCVCGCACVCVPWSSCQSTFG